MLSTSTQERVARSPSNFGLLAFCDLVLLGGSTTIFSSYIYLYLALDSLPLNGPTS